MDIFQMEKDVSVRQQAVDLLYAMCDKTNAEEIVQEMLNYLETADYSIREEMVRSLDSLSVLQNTILPHGVCLSGASSQVILKRKCNTG